ncbi:MAG: chromosomal replication initiator protein DnaA [Pseudomonadota bacterium]|nr:chromosomal replication initiator protein DnaA [Pseudomonadota bacterium]
MIPCLSTKQTWQQCLAYIRENLSSQDDYHAFIAPLQLSVHEQTITLHVPNQYIFNRIRSEFINIIEDSLRHCYEGFSESKIVLRIGAPPSPQTQTSHAPVVKPPSQHPLNKQFTFSQFITGRSNEFAFAAAQQAATSPGFSYNPFVIFGSTGLGKTHLMQAIGHQILLQKPDTNIVYIHAEKFLTEMISALQKGTMNKFKEMLTNADVLMLDDIQFFAHKERSQEELFHRFNEKLEQNQQVILTSDRYPKELNGFEDRLKSRFNWGLSVGVDPPELETRVAILIHKAQQQQAELPQEVAFFIADQIQTNVRELEGILTRLLAHAKFTGETIDINFTKKALRDLLTIHNRQVRLDQIQQAVARYYKIKISDLTGKRRHQAVTRPRQLAMYLAKNLTSKSFPEIGRSFGGRDHTTVLHGCQKISSLIEEDSDLKLDFENLSNLLTH